MSENNAGGTVETPSVEDLQSQLAEKEALLSEKEETLSKAEKKIVELKKSSKEVGGEQGEGGEKSQETPKGLDEEGVRQLLAVEKFIEANPELADHKDKFKELTSSGLSEAGAKAAILAENPEIGNRQKTNASGISGDVLTPDKDTYTMEELSKLSTDDYNVVMSQVDKGEIVIQG